MDGIYLTPRRTLLPISWISAHITSTLFFALSSANVYIGSVFEPKFDQLGIGLVVGFIINIPTVMILLAIPFHYFATELIHKSRYNANFAKYSVWALCGTIIGIPMMGIGSFIFGFGFKLWFNLCLTGAIYGALAALMMRLMVKEDRTSEVNDFA